jgi:hypothetical protein
MSFSFELVYHPDWNLCKWCREEKLTIFLGADILYIIKKTTGPIFAVDLPKNSAEKIFLAHYKDSNLVLYNSLFIGRKYMW